MTPPLDPDNLIEAAVRLDAGALETLLLWHYDALMGFVSQRLTGRDRRRFDAEDVVQQTYRKVFIKIVDFDGKTDAEFRSWLFVCCSNVLKDVRRYYDSSKRSGVRNHVRIDGAIDLIDDAPAAHFRRAQSTPSEVAIQQEEIDQLQVAIQGLCREDQELVKLRHVQQKTIREIAEIKNAGSGEIAYACQRALRRLQRIMSAGRSDFGGEAAQ